MDVWTLLGGVLLLLTVGLLLGAICERLKQSAILGYLAAGVLLGPNALHWIESSEEVSALAELGVALLLFAVGLEFSWSRLKGLGGSVLAGGLAQFLLSAAVAAGLAAVFGVGPRAAIGIGAMMALSSTACVLRLLTARGEVESPHGGQALGILLVQDLAVVPCVLIVTVLSEGGTPLEMLWGTARTLLFAIGLIGVLLLLFKYIVPVLLTTGPLHGNRELPVLLAVVSGLGAAMLAHSFGVSPALGAFVAGMLLAESPFAVQVRADVSSLETLLMTLFFTTVGMLADPAWILDHAGLVAASVAFVIFFKAAVAFAALRLLRVARGTALAAGLCIAQIGEFSFILAEIGRGGLLSEDLFLLIVSTTILTLFASPGLVALAPRLGARFASASEPRGDEDRPGAWGEVAAIVIGFGPAGRRVAKRVRERTGGPVAIVELSAGGLTAARAEGYHAIAGDARHADVLEHAGLARARSVVVTLPDARVAGDIIRLVRHLAPQVFVVARARFHRFRQEIESAGVHVVVDEETEVGQGLYEALDEVLPAAADASDSAPTDPGSKL